MECPACATDTLSPISLKKTEQEIDVCGQCNGYWFDQSELCRLLSHDDSGRSETFKASGLALTCDNPCPRCSRDLVECFYKNTKIYVQVCTDCNGVWVPKESWDALVFNIKDQPQIAEIIEKKPPDMAGKVEGKQKNDEGTQQNQAGLNTGRAQQFRASSTSVSPLRMADLDVSFLDAKEFKIHQYSHSQEVFSPIETPNTYKASIIGKERRDNLIREKNSSVSNRLIGRYLGAFRQSDLEYINEVGACSLRMYKRLAFLIPEMLIEDKQYRKIGRVRGTINPFKQDYLVYEAGSGNHHKPIMVIKGPILGLGFRYRIYKDNVQCGMIKKNWTMMDATSYTRDKYKYTAHMDECLSLVEKTLVFGALFLITFSGLEI